MAQAVDHAMRTKGRLLAEAGTGVGKSFAYLLPALLRCMTTDEVVVVATNTIALQEQLIRKDVPLLRELLEPAEDVPAGSSPRIRPCLVKGRGNYVSIRRLRLASQRQDKLFADPAARRSLHVIEDWAYTTTDGTLSSMPALERPGVWDKVESDSANCMGRKCPNHEQCFYQSARREMEKSNLLVCNHAVFFADLALRGEGVGFLPQYHHVILDEAHGVEDVASEHFGVSLTEGRVMHLLTTLYQPRANKGYLPQLALADDDTRAVETAIRLVLQAQETARIFFEEVVTLSQRTGQDKPWSGGGGSDWNASVLRLRAAGQFENALTPMMRQLELSLKALKDSCKNEADRFELNGYAIRAGIVAEQAQTLVDQKLPGCAYWAEIGSATESRQRRVTLAGAPVEVGPLLRERLFKGEFSVTLTSATLATKGSGTETQRERAEAAFMHTMSRLGCDDAVCLQLGSPFDYATQAELIVDTTSANAMTSWTGKASYDAMAERILEHVKQTNGGAFVLFTSFAALRGCAKLLRNQFEDARLSLFAQGMDGSREEILARFKEHPNSVLFGAASFWQGVDVRGEALRNVIITKLPFDPPDRPLTEARSELIKERGGDPFNEDSLPRAVIRFKQGFGRLIRSREDRGRVVVLDPRVVTARYGKRFLDALPKGVPLTRL